LIHILKIERGNLLLFAVFVESEVSLLQISDWDSLFVAGDYVDEDEFGGNVDCGGCLAFQAPAPQKATRARKGPLR